MSKRILNNASIYWPKIEAVAPVIFTFDMKTYVKHDAIKMRTKAIDVHIICSLAVRAVPMPAPQDAEITAVSH